MKNIKDKIEGNVVAQIIVGSVGTAAVVSTVDLLKGDPCKAARDAVVFAVGLPVALIGGLAAACHACHH